MKQHRFWAWGAVICMVMVMSDTAFLWFSFTPTDI